MDIFNMDINNIGALSIKQPWASLIIKGIKNIENRKWATKHKWILIHSSAKFDKNHMKTE